MRHFITAIALSLSFIGEAKAGLMEEIGPCVIMTSRPSDCETDPWCVELANNTDDGIAPTFTFSEEVVVPQLVRDRCGKLGRVIVTDRYAMQGVQDPNTKVFYPVIPARESSSRPTYRYMYAPAMKMTVAGQGWTGKYNKLNLVDVIVNGVKARLFQEYVQRGVECGEQEVNIRKEKTITFGDTCS